ncbi:MAG: cobalt-factor II C(20)-methyltransferase [ANME-2 cluster archaeon]|jgi:precorrin-2/cobalt-factor-2 C20-methyltransferase|nr:cobalt-factor II C(20)-methyltransferase [ANME-2 cluster archaeon]
MLVGVGLGPGDPELLTLKAIEILKRSDIVFVPGRLAAQLVEPYAEPHLLEFPMTKDKSVLQSCWEENADMVAQHARNGLVAFGLIGDPNFFSTFTHLRRLIRQRHPDIIIETVPGISSITAFAARSDIQIESSFQVSDGSPVTDRIILKARRPGQIVNELVDEGFEEFTLAQKLYTEDEDIIKGKENMPEKADYFSMIHARKTRER